MQKQGSVVHEKYKAREGMRQPYLQLEYNSR